MQNPELAAQIAPVALGAWGYLVLGIFLGGSIGFLWWKLYFCCQKVHYLETKLGELYGEVTTYKHWTEARIDELWDCAQCGDDRKTAPPGDPQWP